jgi:hypothetical protein
MTSSAPLEWNIKSDAAAGYFIYDLSIITMLSNLNAVYLSGPLAGQAPMNPPLPAPFVPSVPLGPGGYAALALNLKQNFQTEKSEWDRRVKAATDLRTSHASKTGSANALLLAKFTPTCVCGKSIYNIMKAGQLAALDPGVIFFNMLTHITTAFAPTQATDATVLILKLAAADFHDGRGFEINASEFLETFDQLTLLNAAPVPLIMQKNVASAIRLFPRFDKDLSALRELNDADAAALLLGVPLPAIPRWRTMLETCTKDIRAYIDWDFNGKTTSAGYKTKTQPKAKDTKANSSTESKAPYCSKCGRNNHSLDKCVARRCLCGRRLDQGNCNVKDAAHDKLRADYVPYERQSSGQSSNQSSGSNFNRKEGDRNLSRRNPKQDSRSNNEKKLDSQLKSNDSHNANMTKYLDEGQRLVEQNMALRAAIEKSDDHHLAKSMALIPYKASSVFKSNSSSQSKRKRGASLDE